MNPRAILLTALFLAAPLTGPAADELAPAAIPADAPCRIIQAEKPQFPVRMLKDGVTHGTVRLLVHIDPTGAIIDQLVTASSRVAFAEEAQRAIGAWTFEPSRAGGEPISTILDLTFNFDVSGVILVERYGTSETSPAEALEPYEYHACSLNDLDRMPTPLGLTQPIYPEEWREQGIAGRVTIQFYIDETGRVRFATVLDSTHDHLAAVALAAVRQWRFAPPTSKGKPALVRAQQVFSFGLNKAPAP